MKSQTRSQTARRPGCLASGRSGHPLTGGCPLAARRSGAADARSHRRINVRRRCCAGQDRPGHLHQTLEAAPTQQIRVSRRHRLRAATARMLLATTDHPIPVADRLTQCLLKPPDRPARDRRVRQDVRQSRLGSLVGGGARPRCRSRRDGRGIGLTGRGQQPGAQLLLDNQQPQQRNTARDTQRLVQPQSEHFRYPTLRRLLGATAGWKTVAGAFMLGP